MAYGNYNNNGGGYQQRQGGYNNGYQRQGNNNYQSQQQQTTPPPPSPEEFINKRLDLYQQFQNAIRERGLDPADFAFGLTQWVTSYEMELKKR